MTKASVLLLDQRGDPAIEQQAVNGWFLSWNPDNARFYVSRDKRTFETAATFAELRNARQYAKGHDVATSAKRRYKGPSGVAP